MKEAPEGWILARMKDLVCINPTKAKPDYEDETLLVFVPMARVAEEFGGIDVTERRPFAAIKRGYTQFQPGDVLFAKITPCMENGKIAIVPEIRPPVGYGSTEFLVMRSRTDGIGPWIAYWVARSRFRELARQHMQGAVGQRRVPKVWLQDVSIPLAPLPEQHRIVAKIESLLARLDEGLATLKRAKTNLERYRASVLKAAVEGRLTAQWREVNPPKESGEKLLEQILAERRQRWETEQLAKFEAKGKRPPKNWEKKYKEPVAPDTSELPGLPEGWCWVTLPQLGDFGRGKSKHRPRGDPSLYGGDFPFIQTSEVARASGWIRHHLKTYNHLGLSQSRLWPEGTLCITIAANIAETGILAYPACFPDSIVGLVTKRPTLTKFLDYFMRTVRSDLTRYAPATAQKNINLATLSELAVPLPPAVEQERIVKLLERLVTVQEATVGTVTRTCGPLVQHLRNAILECAFEGRLVPQDPSDESASVLLERTKIEAASKKREWRPSKPRRQRKSQVT